LSERRAEKVGKAFAHDKNPSHKPNPINHFHDMVGLVLCCYHNAGTADAGNEIIRYRYHKSEQNKSVW
jgi:hypothetical protein